MKCRARLYLLYALPRSLSQSPHVISASQQPVPINRSTCSLSTKPSELNNWKLVYFSCKLQTPQELSSSFTIIINNNKKLAVCTRLIISLHRLPLLRRLCFHRHFCLVVSRIIEKQLDRISQNSVARWHMGQRNDDFVDNPHHITLELRQG